MNDSYRRSAVRRPGLAHFLGVIAACAAVLAPSASASPITIGPPLATTSFESGGCFYEGGCDAVALKLPGNALVASPVDGVVISWSIKGASNMPGYGIRVLERAGAEFRDRGKSALRTPAGSGLLTFPTAIPIKEGQYIGLIAPFHGTFGVASPAGSSYAFNHPAIGDGGAAVFEEFSIGDSAFSAVIQPEPTIASLSPNGGPVTGGTSVQISGTDFENATSVKFGGVAVPFSASSETTIVATAPPRTTLGPVPVAVTTVAGTATSRQEFVYVAAVPQPTTGPPTSNPRPTCHVPALKGRTLKSAKKRLKAAGCRVGKLEKKDGATAKDGEVVKQVPKPGTTVSADIKVRIVLAR
jgi:hypothetical protein